MKNIELNFQTEVVSSVFLSLEKLFYWGGKIRKTCNVIIFPIKLVPYFFSFENFPRFKN